MEKSKEEVKDRVELYNTTAIPSMFTIIAIQGLLFFLYAQYFSRLEFAVQVPTRTMVILYAVFITGGVMRYKKNRLANQKPCITFSKKGITSIYTPYDSGKLIRYKWETISKITFSKKDMILELTNNRMLVAFKFTATTTVSKIELLEAINKYKPDTVEIKDNGEDYINYTPEYLITNYIIQAVILLGVQIILLYVFSLFIGLGMLILLVYSIYVNNNYLITVNKRNNTVKIRDRAVRKVDNIYTSSEDGVLYAKHKERSMKIAKVQNLLKIEEGLAKNKV
ncbi:MAG: hypothetical protein FWC68_02665 [Oscillospiraceae bacterium]|nr:hypothetical protein [Oscillospiraceae bacterium]